MLVGPRPMLFSIMRHDEAVIYSFVAAAVSRCNALVAQNGRTNALRHGPSDRILTSSIRKYL
jgi:hypothetical protein